jgi:hypothetical protein
MIWHFHVSSVEFESWIQPFQLDQLKSSIELFNSSTRVLSKHPYSVQYPPIDLSKHPHPVRVEDLKLKSSIDSIDKVEFNFQVTIEQHELYFLKSVLVISMSAPFW